MRRSPAAARVPASDASAVSSSSASDDVISRANASRMRLSASDSTGRPTTASTWMSSSSTWRPDGLSGTGAPAAWSSVQPASGAMEDGARRRARESAAGRRARTGHAAPRPPSRRAPRPRRGLGLRRRRDERRETRSRSRRQRRRERPTARAGSHPRSIVNVCTGGVKYQLTSRKPTTAAVSAGQTPPTAEITTTSSRNNSSTLGNPRSVRRFVRTQVSSGQPDRARAGSRAAPAAAAGHAGAAFRAAVAWRSVVGPADHVHVEADAGVADHPVDHRAAGQLGEPGAACRSEHDLGRVERAGSRDERLADVGSDHLAIRPTELFDELALAVERSAAPPASPSCGRT